MQFNLIIFYAGTNVFGHKEFSDRLNEQILGGVALTLSGRS